MVDLDERHVLVADREADRGEQLVARPALDGQDRVVAVQVRHRDTLGRRCREPPDDLRGVGRVGDQEDLVVAAQVGDQVVDDAAVVLAAQRVLRLADGDATEVVGEAARSRRRRRRAR